MKTDSYAAIRELLKATFGVEDAVQRSKDAVQGDWALPAFALAKSQGVAPLAAAESLAARWNADEAAAAVARAEAAAPGFVNFFLTDAFLLASASAALADEKFGHQPRDGKRVIVEYASPNIAKQMHIGHIRTTTIGAALANLYETQGYDVVRASHPGDWGTQFGTLIDQYKKEYGDDAAAARNFSIDDLESMYVRWNAEAKEDPSRKESARAWLVKLQKGDEYATELWQAFCAVSVADSSALFARLGIRFDENAVRGESAYHAMLAPLVDASLEFGAEYGDELEGVGKPVIVKLEEYGIDVPLMLRKSDGGYGYHATDLATIKYRQEIFNADGMLAGVRYVVGAEQTLHFRQLFAAARKLGLLSDESAPQWQHVSYALILGESGKKFSTRKGNAVHLRELLDRAAEYALAATREKRPDLAEAEASSIAETIGIGSLVFAVLSQSNNSPITFDWDRMLDFSGDGAAYLMYASVRVNSLLKKADYSAKSLPSADGLPETVRAALRLVQYYPAALAQAARDNQATAVASYALELAAAITAVYHDGAILDLPPAERELRLGALATAAALLRRSLALLNVRVPESM